VGNRRLKLGAADKLERPTEYIGLEGLSPLQMEANLVDVSEVSGRATSSIFASKAQKETATLD